MLARQVCRVHPESNGFGKEVAATFGIRLQRRRAELQLTQEDVANRAGISRTYYGSLEKGVNDRSRGEPANPTLSILLRLASALDCRVGNLVDNLDCGLASGNANN